MTARFHATVNAEGVSIALLEKSLLGNVRHLPLAQWGRLPAHRSVAYVLHALIAEGKASATDTEVKLPSVVAAALHDEVAEQIDLPPLAPLGLSVALDGRIETRDGRLRLRWTDRSGHEVRPERIG